MLGGLAQRSVRPERMDDPSLPPAEHTRALAGLRRINAISLSGYVVWRALRRFVDHARPLVLLDVACGGGDVLVAIARRARRAGVALELHGCDISPHALGLAEQRLAAAGFSFTAHAADCLDPQAMEPDIVDVTLSTLFLHHCVEAQARQLIASMTLSARCGCVLADLERSRLGYLAALLGSRVLSRSPVVHTDALLSVRAALSLHEVRDLLADSGVQTAAVRRAWPFRFVATWEAG
jgi:2-polyprenyl-3-methyl-5-hydroxy-6-metoxy-1,4-benzoquinol methylase